MIREALMERNRQAEDALIQVLDGLTRYVLLLAEAYSKVAANVARDEEAKLVEGAVRATQLLAQVSRGFKYLSSEGLTIIEAARALERDPKVGYMATVIGRRVAEPEEDARLKQAREDMAEAVKFFESVINGQGGVA